MLELMRDWLLDCYNDEQSQYDIRSASPERIKLAVAREYDGGIIGFCRDAGVPLLTVSFFGQELNPNSEDCTAAMGSTIWCQYHNTIKILMLAGF